MHRSPWTYPASIEDGGRLKDSASHICHFILHHDPKLPHVRVRVETGAPHLKWPKCTKPNSSTSCVQGTNTSAPAKGEQNEIHSHPCLVSGTALTNLLISSCLSGADLAVARIIVEVWLSVSFLMHLCPATMLHTWNFPKERKLNTVQFFFWLTTFLSLMHHWISQHLAAQKSACQYFNPFSLWPSCPSPKIQNSLWVYLPPEEGMCVSAPVQLVNMEGEGSVKLICACP